MFDNIGDKIKVLAKVMFFLELITALIMGFALMFGEGETGGVGLIVFFVGPIVAWISSALLYGFGELIDKTCDIAENTRKYEILSRISKL